MFTRLKFRKGNAWQKIGNSPGYANKDVFQILIARRIAKHVIFQNKKLRKGTVQQKIDDSPGYANDFFSEL